ncbi:hypothetical protein IW261DRAFT_1574301 [Armillaria novae-zelandiae]|uniref:Uncharacterized protein n=1 Tax=Armillaria novae-zelandiae TaxID=153914 RepID=A0AA39T5X2_9AGAR|nr:hypothetical protein IW261DRAFT_1574301 [Armillaria novae-zelandiae]
MDDVDDAPCTPGSPFLCTDDAALTVSRPHFRPTARLQYDSQTPDCDVYCGSGLVDTTKTSFTVPVFVVSSPALPFLQPRKFYPPRRQPKDTASPGLRWQHRYRWNAPRSCCRPSRATISRVVTDLDRAPGGQQLISKTTTNNSARHYEWKDKTTRRWRSWTASWRGVVLVPVRRRDCIIDVGVDFGDEGRNKRPEMMPMDDVDDPPAPTAPTAYVQPAVSPRCYPPDPGLRFLLQGDD